MQLRLDVPRLLPDVADVRVSEWRKAEGDRVERGEVICVLSIGAKAAIVRVAPALKALPTSPAADAEAKKVRTMPLTGVYTAVRASDEGVLRRRLLQSGQPVETGTPLALLTQTPDEPLDEAAMAASAVFRSFAESEARDQKPRKAPPQPSRLLPLRWYQQVLGDDTKLEKAVRKRFGPRIQAKQQAPTAVEVVRGAHWTTTITKKTVVVRADEEKGPRVGVFLWGGCDLPAFLEAATRVAHRVPGMLVVQTGPVRLKDTQARLMLQALDGVPVEHIEEACANLPIGPSMFSPEVFEPTFTMPEEFGGELSKSLTVMSLGAETIRPLYRHREHGYLVDPGGMWLDGQIESAMRNKDARAWFKANFVKVGRIEVDEFRVVYRRLVEELRARTGGDVAVLNSLVVEPGDHTHNYQHRRLPEAARRREFHIALGEMSIELGVAMVDVDRALKRARVEGQLDFAHFPEDKYGDIADEIEELLIDMALVS